MVVGRGLGVRLGRAWVVLSIVHVVIMAITRGVRVHGRDQGLDDLVAVHDLVILTFVTSHLGVPNVSALEVK